MRPTYPFLLDAIVFGLFGTLLAGILFLAYAGDPVEQAVMCLLVAIPTWFVAIALATTKRYRRSAVRRA